MNTLSSISQLRVKHDNMLIAFFILILVNLSFESTSDLLNCKCLECDDDSTVGKLYNDTCYYISVNDRISYDDGPSNTFKPNLLPPDVPKTVIDGIISQVTAELYNQFGYDVIYLNYTSSDYFTTIKVVNSDNRCLKMNITNNTIYYDTNCNFELAILKSTKFRPMTKIFYKCRATIEYKTSTRRELISGTDCMNTVLNSNHRFIEDSRCLYPIECKLVIFTKNVSLSSKTKFTGVVEVFNQSLPLKTLYAISDSQYNTAVSRDNYCYKHFDWCYHQLVETKETIVHRAYPPFFNSNSNDDNECINSINQKKGMLTSQQHKCIFFASETNTCTIAELDTISDLEIFERFVNNVSKKTIIERCSDISSTKEWDNCMLKTYKYQFFIVYLSNSIVNSIERSYFAILGNKAGAYFADVVKRRLIYKKDYQDGIFEMKSMYKDTEINHICEEPFLPKTASTAKSSVNPYYIDITKRSTISKKHLYTLITTSRPVTVPMNHKENEEKTNVTIFIFTTCVISLTIIVFLAIHLIIFSLKL